MAKRKTIHREDCHEVFLKFLKIKLDNPNTTVFTFVPRDVICFESMFEKQHSRKFTQSEMKCMGNYLSSVQDEIQHELDIDYTVTVQRIKDGGKKVYRLEVLKNE